MTHLVSSNELLPSHLYNDMKAMACSALSFYRAVTEAKWEKSVLNGFYDAISQGKQADETKILIFNICSIKGSST